MVKKKQKERGYIKEKWKASESNICIKNMQNTDKNWGPGSN